MTVCVKLLRGMLLLATTIGCAAEAKAPRSPLVPSDSLATAVQGEPITQRGSLTFPTRLRTVGDYLAVLTPNDSVVIHVLQRTTGAELIAVGRHGFGGDFKNVWALAAGPPGSSIVWVYDLTAREMVAVDLRASVERKVLVTAGRIALKAPATLTAPVVTLGGNVVSPGFFEGGRLAVFDSTGALLQYAGAPPAVLGLDDVGMAQRAYQSAAVRAPTSSRIALATRHADQLELLDWSKKPGTWPHAAPFGFKPGFHVVRDAKGVRHFATDSTTRYGFIDVDATDEAVFLLYSGRSPGDDHSRSDVGMYVFVYSWSGHPVATLRLDAGATGIGVATDGRFVYTVNAYDESGVRRYRLPRLGSLPGAGRDE